MGARHHPPADWWPSPTGGPVPAGGLLTGAVVAVAPLTVRVPRLAARPLVGVATVVDDLEVGDRVLVGFLEDRVDLPVVLGRLA